MTNGRDDVIFAEGWNVTPLSLLLCVVVLLAVLVFGVFKSALLFFIALFGIIIAVAVWSDQWYNRLELTNTKLRAGRDAVPLTEIDKEFPVVRATDYFEQSELQALERPWFRSQRDGGRLRFLGGALGAGLGRIEPWAVLRHQPTGQLLMVRVKDLDEFNAHLGRALS